MSNSLKLALLSAAAKANQKSESLKKKEVDKKKDKSYISPDLDAILSYGGTALWKGLSISVHTDVKKDTPEYKYHFKAATGNKVFVKTNKRELAQQFVDEWFGKGKYRVSGY